MNTLMFTCWWQNILVHAGSDRRLMFWDAIVGESIRELEGSAALKALAMHPSREVFASGDASGNIELWNYDQGTRFAVGQAHTGEVLRCAFSPCGSLLASVDSHGAIMLWNTTVLQTDAP